MNAIDYPSPYITADELRDLLNDNPTAADLEELDALLAGVPVDFDAFEDRMTSASHTESGEAALMACALPGQPVDAEFAALIVQAMAARGRLMREAAAELLADIAKAIRMQDSDALAAVLVRASFDSDAYCAHLRALADAAAPGETADPARIRMAQVQALRACATSGTVMDEELAGAVLDALAAWCAIKFETPEQRAIREAFTRARTLMDTLGDDDPRTRAAVIDAIELQDPGCCGRMMAKCGIKLAPTHYTADGLPLYSLDAIADALGTDTEDLMPALEELGAAGLSVRRVPAGVVQ